MHALYDLRDMLCRELEEYGKKNELSAGTLEIVDKLTHALKNLDKVIETYEDEGYSNRGRSYRNRSYAGNSNDYNSYNSMDSGYESYARGRNSNARRDGRGRYSNQDYSRTGDMTDRLRDLMNEAPDDRTRTEIQRLVNKMEQM